MFELSNFNYMMDQIEIMLDKLGEGQLYGVSCEWKNWRFDIQCENDRITIKPVKIEKEPHRV